MDLYLDFWNCYLAIIKNFIRFTKEKYKEKIYRTLRKKMIMDQIENLHAIKTEIQNLTEDFILLVLKFLKCFQILKAKN